MSLLFYSPTHSPCPCLCPYSCLCQAHPSLFSPASPSLTARICSGDKLPLRGGCPRFQGPLHFPLLAHYSHLHSLCLLLSRNASTHCMPPTSAVPRLEQGSLGCDSAAYRETPVGCLHQQHSQPSNRMGKEWVIAKLLGRSVFPQHRMPSALPDITHHSRAALWRAWAFPSLFHGWEAREVTLAAQTHPNELGGASANERLPPAKEGLSHRTRK